MKIISTYQKLCVELDLTNGNMTWFVNPSKRIKKERRALLCQKAYFNGYKALMRDSKYVGSISNNAPPLSAGYTLISAKNSGIGNRLKNIASCFRVIDRLKKLGHDNTSDFKILWHYDMGYMNSMDKTTEKVKKRWRPPTEFSSLFKNKNVEFSEVPIQELEKVSGLNVHALRSGLIPYNSWRLVVFDDDEIPYGFSENIDKFSAEGRSIDFEYNRVPEKIKSEYITAFKKLILADEIKKKIDSFSKNNFNKDTVSVHIRSFCDPPGKHGLARGKYKFNIDSFIEAMNKESLDKSFFIASDSDDVIERIKKEFGDRVIFRYVEEKSAEDDLIDLYLLSKNNKIIGTENSTFTEVAWWLSECSADICIV
mgnify:CR=1 FL=1